MRCGVGVGFMGGVLGWGFVKFLRSELGLRKNFFDGVATFGILLASGAARTYKTGMNSLYFRQVRASGCGAQE